MPLLLLEQANEIKVRACQSSLHPRRLNADCSARVVTQACPNLARLHHAYARSLAPSGQMLPSRPDKPGGGFGTRNHYYRGRHPQVSSKQYPSTSRAFTTDRGSCQRVMLAGSLVSRSDGSAVQLYGCAEHGEVVGTERCESRSTPSTGECCNC
jgi:hypothetical protein